MFCVFYSLCVLCYMVEKHFTEQFESGLLVLCHVPGIATKCRTACPSVAVCNRLSEAKALSSRAQ